LKIWKQKIQKLISKYVLIFIIDLHIENKFLIYFKYHFNYLKYILNWLLLVLSKVWLMERQHWKFIGTRIKQFAKTVFHMRHIKIFLIPVKCTVQSKKLSGPPVSCVIISNSFANADQSLWLRETIHAQGLAKKLKGNVEEELLWPYSYDSPSTFSTFSMFFMTFSLSYDGAITCAHLTFPSKH